MSQLIKRITKKGFTLIELMIVVAIIGILAAIAIPKFADLISKSRESAIKGSLGSVRGAITIYYSDQEGLWPGFAGTWSSFQDALTLNTKYMDAVPTISKIPSNQVSSGHSSVGGAAYGTASLGDTGNWIYVSSGTGQFLVNCTHKDSKELQWSSF